MNRIATSIMLFISVIIVCGIELFKINYVSEKIKEDLTLIQTLVSDDEMSKAKDLSSSIYDFWEDNSRILAIFVQHDTLDNIEEALALMDSAIEKDEVADFWSENLRAYIQISNLNDTIYPTIENVL